MAYIHGSVMGFTAFCFFSNVVIFSHRPLWWLTHQRVDLTTDYPKNIRKRWLAPITVRFKEISMHCFITIHFLFIFNNCTIHFF